MENKKETLLKTLKNSEIPLTTRKIAKLSNLRKHKISKIINALKKEGQVESSKRYYYKAK